jgi:hypothetical protein
MQDGGQHTVSQNCIRSRAIHALPLDNPHLTIVLLIVHGKRIRLIRITSTTPNRHVHGVSSFHEFHQNDRHRTALT